ncbi:GntR family transcriptional regulator [Shimia sp.]|uniref:GntR family transcriptional regulator n=1 Tax=Shimia sp. TaxID=1954381 RepID=UPI003B8AB98C
MLDFSSLIWKPKFLARERWHHMSQEDPTYKTSFNRSLGYCAGRGKLGSLPSEIELFQLLGISRTAVRAVLARLSEFGVIQWSRRNPTVPTSGIHSIVNPVQPPDLGRRYLLDVEPAGSTQYEIANIIDKAESFELNSLGGNVVILRSRCVSMGGAEIFPVLIFVSRSDTYDPVAADWI